MSLYCVLSSAVWAVGLSVPFVHETLKYNNNNICTFPQPRAYVND